MVITFDFNRRCYHYEMNRDSAGFYHDPPVWIMSSAVDYTAPLSGEQQFHQPNFESMREVVYETTIASAIRFKVTREGLFSFSFASWSSGTYPPERNNQPSPFAAQAQVILERTSVMNSFLALLYTRELEMNNFAHERMVVTPEFVISLSSFDGDSGMGFGNQRVSRLALSSYPRTYSSGPAMLDDRISQRGMPIAITSLRAATRDLSRILRGPDDGLMIVDLFSRSSKLFQDHNYSAALISYWTITERLLSELWVKYQESNRTRSGEVFISNQRKEILNDGRSFSASVITEILSLNRVLARSLYVDITQVRKKRNSWIHGGSGSNGVSSDDAILATSVCEQLMLKTRRLKLIGQKGLRIHG